jgi:hypothetical protein
LTFSNEVDTWTSLLFYFIWISLYFYIEKNIFYWMILNNIKSISFFDINNLSETTETYKQLLSDESWVGTICVSCISIFR